MGNLLTSCASGKTDEDKREKGNNNAPTFKPAASTSVSASLPVANVSIQSPVSLAGTTSVASAASAGSAAAVEATVEAIAPKITAQASQMAAEVACDAEKATFSTFGRGDNKIKTVRDSLVERIVTSDGVEEDIPFMDAPRKISEVVEAVSESCNIPISTPVADVNLEATGPGTINLGLDEKSSIEQPTVTVDQEDEAGIVSTLSNFVTESKAEVAVGAQQLVDDVVAQSKASIDDTIAGFSSSIAGLSGGAVETPEPTVSLSGGVETQMGEISVPEVTVGASNDLSAVLEEVSVDEVADTEIVMGHAEAPCGEISSQNLSEDITLPGVMDTIEDGFSIGKEIELPEGSVGAIFSQNGDMELSQNEDSAVDINLPIVTGAIDAGFSMEKETGHPEGQSTEIFSLDDAGISFDSAVELPKAESDAMVMNLPNITGTLENVVSEAEVSLDTAVEPPEGEDVSGKMDDIVSFVPELTDEIKSISTVMVEDVSVTELEDIKVAIGSDTKHSLDTFILNENATPQMHLEGDPITYKAADVIPSFATENIETTRTKIGEIAGDILPAEVANEFATTAQNFLGTSKLSSPTEYSGGAKLDTNQIDLSSELELKTNAATVEFDEGIPEFGASTELQENESGANLISSLADNVQEQLPAAATFSSTADDILKRYNLSSFADNNVNAGIDFSNVTSTFSSNGLFQGTKSSVDDSFGNSLAAVQQQSENLLQKEAEVTIDTNVETESYSSFAVGENVGISLAGTQPAIQGNLPSFSMN